MIVYNFFLERLYLDSISISVLGNGIVDKERFTFIYRIMAHIPINPYCMWNYCFCELMDLGIEIEDDWYSVGNIEYDALDDLRGDFPYLFEDDVVPVDGWEEIDQEPIEHDTDNATNER
jgi:hypothetical protein